MKTKPDDYCSPLFDEFGHLIEKGLTKREHFASIAMEGMIVRGGYHCPFDVQGAVQYADALILELNRTDGESN